MANHEPSNNEVTKADFEGNEESWVVRDAFETMVSKGLSDYQKKLQLEKLMNLGSGKRRELSDEWKELCAEEVKLNIKKFKFSAMLAEAANGKLVLLVLLLVCEKICLSSRSSMFSVMSKSVKSLSFM